jgi:hypothetical protein
MWRTPHQGYLQLVGIFCGASNDLQLLNEGRSRARRFSAGETAVLGLAAAQQAVVLPLWGLEAKPPVERIHKVVDTVRYSYFF